MKTKPANLKILRIFKSYSGPQLGVFTGNVSVCLDPAIFLNLPVAPKDLKALADDLNAKLAATITGGTLATAAKDKAFDAVTDALNADANIVENVVGTDLELLLSTGYLPVSTNRTASPLDDTAIVSLSNNGTTQALLQLLPVRNAKSFQIQSSMDGGKTWVEAGISTQARRFVLASLIPAQRMPCGRGPLAAAPGRAVGPAPPSSCPPEIN